MELAVYFASLERLFDIEEALRAVPYRDVSDILYNLVFCDANAVEYACNLFALEKLHEMGERLDEPSRLYFGQEFCEFLIPDTDELEKAYSFARQLGWHFTYVTGFVTDARLSQLEQNLAFLARQARGAEVVVSDWGVLALLAGEFPELRPVLGRLLTKQIRFARFTAKPPPVCMDAIDAPEQQIRLNQEQALRGLGLSISEYRDELQRLGVERVELDIVPQSVDLPPGTWGMGVSCYYPWGYVSGKRNCLTSANADPDRQYVVLDKACPKLCRELNTSAEPAGVDEILVERGNAVFVYHDEWAAAYLDGRIPIDRLVLEPYIPLS